MNYLSELRVFHSWQPDNLHDTAAICLWYALMGVANNCGWQEWFTVPITTLEARTGLKRSTVYNALNKLVCAERVEVRKRSGRQSAMYRLCPLDGRYTDTSLDANRTQGWTQTEHKPGPLNKPKRKLKLKRISTTTNSARAKDSPDDENADLRGDATALNLALSEVERAAVGIGLPFAATDEETATQLIATYTAPWVLEAIRRTADRPGDKRSWGYVRGILRNFSNQGGPDDARKPTGRDSPPYHGGKRNGSHEYSDLGRTVHNL